MKTIAIVPSAGKGTRLNKNSDKPFVKILAKELLAHTLSVLDASRIIDGIILVVHKDFIARAQVLVKKYRFCKVMKIVQGGRRRADSVSNGLKELPLDTEIVLIHDGARPCVTEKNIKDSTAAALKYGASCVCMPVKPTIKAVKNGRITKTLDRRELWEAQTPQVFKKDIILKAYGNKKNFLSATDDAGVAEKAGYGVRVVMGDYRNIKVTTPEDIVFVEKNLRS